MNSEEFKAAIEIPSKTNAQVLEIKSIQQSDDSW